MTTLQSLYRDLNHFRSYASGIDSSATFLELDSSAKSACKRICIILTRDVYNDVAKALAGDEKKEALLTAMANLPLYNQLPYYVIKLRKSDVDLYKTEQEAVMSYYIENYYNAMDSLIADLVDDKNELWKGSRFYTLMETL